MGGQLVDLVDICIRVEHPLIEIQEDAHLALGHCITAAIRAELEREMAQASAELTLPRLSESIQHTRKAAAHRYPLMIDLPKQELQRAVFLDRDGVICVNRPDHVKNWDEFQFLPAAKEGLAILSRLGLPFIVVNNQAVINRGIVPTETVIDIHHRMVAEITSAGGRIDGVLFCPHREDENCDCRKPEPGLLWQAAQQFRLDLAHSYMVGDAATDIMAGNRVGCRSFLVLTGRGQQQLAPTHRAAPRQFKVAGNLMEAVLEIIGMESAIKDRPEFSPRDKSSWLGASAAQRTLFG